MAYYLISTTCYKISIFTKKGTEYNLAKVERYVLNQAGNSIDTYIKCEGLDFFVEKLKKRESRLQRHQEVLISNHNREKANEKEKARKQADNTKSSE